MATHAELLTHLDEQGYVVLEGILSAAQAEALRRRSIELAAQEHAGGAVRYLDGKSQRVWNLVNKDPLFAEVIQLPAVLALHEYLLGTDCILSSFTVNLIGPGSPAGALHIDYPLSKLPPPLPAFALCANSIYLLDDFTRENGATWVIPGSHKRGYGPSEGVAYADMIQLRGKKGDVVIIDGRIWHGSGANQTTDNRVALLGFFCRAFMKPQQDHLHLVAPAIIEQGTPTLQRLLGLTSQPNRYG